MRWIQIVCEKSWRKTVKWGLCHVEEEPQKEWSWSSFLCGSCLCGTSCWQDFLLGVQSSLFYVLLDLADPYCTSSLCLRPEWHIWLSCPVWGILSWQRDPHACFEHCMFWTEFDMLLLWPAIYSNQNFQLALLNSNFCSEVLRLYLHSSSVSLVAAKLKPGVPCPLQVLPLGYATCLKGLVRSRGRCDKISFGFMFVILRQSLCRDVWDNNPSRRTSNLWHGGTVICIRFGVGWESDVHLCWSAGHTQLISCSRGRSIAWLMYQRKYQG